jgi:hypothetical protein
MRSDVILHKRNPKYSQYLQISIWTTGCRPPPPSSKPVTAGRNQVNYPPPPHWDRRVI